MTSAALVSAGAAVLLRWQHALAARAAARRPASWCRSRPAGRSTSWRARCPSNWARSWAARCWSRTSPVPTAPSAPTEVLRADARWQHALDHQRRRGGDQPGAVRQAALRHAARLRAGVAGGQQRRAAGGQRRTTRPTDAADFVAPARKNSSPTRDGLVRHRQHSAPGDRAAGRLPPAASSLHVPYKGAAPAITDVMGGQVAGFFGDVPGPDRPGQGRQAASAIGIAVEQAPSGAAGCARRWRSRASRASTPINWYALFVSAKTPAADHRCPEQGGAPHGRRRRRCTTRLLQSGAEPADRRRRRNWPRWSRRDTDKWAQLIKAKNIKVD